MCLCIEEEKYQNSFFLYQNFVGQKSFLSGNYDNRLCELHHGIGT